MRRPISAIGPPKAIPIWLLFVFLVSSRAMGARGALEIAVPDHVFQNPGDYITTPFTPTVTLTANFVTMSCLEDVSGDPAQETFEVAITSEDDTVLASAEITDNFETGGDCDGHRYSFDVPDTVLSGGTTYRLRTTARAGTPVRARRGAHLYHDQALPTWVNTVGIGGMMYQRMGTEPPKTRDYEYDGFTVIEPFVLPESTAGYVILGCLEDTNDDAGSETFEVAITSDPAGINVLASADLTNNFRQTGGCDRHAYLFDLHAARLTPGGLYYLKKTATSGAPIRSLGPDHLFFTLGLEVNEYALAGGGHLGMASGQYQIDIGVLGENAITKSHGTSASFRVEDGFVIDQARPREVRNLQFQNKTVLRWTEERWSKELGGSYNMYRGALSQLPSGFGSCRAPGLTSTSYEDTEVPSAGEGFFYLVTAKADHEEGSMGQSHDRPNNAWRERANTNPCSAE